MPPRRRAARRASAEAAVNNIALCVAAETSTDRLGAAAPLPPPTTAVLPRERNVPDVPPHALDRNNPRELFSFLGWDCHRNLPSLEQRTALSVDALKESSPNGWSCLRQSTLNAAVHVAETLYPRDPTPLLESIGIERGKESVSMKKTLKTITEMEMSCAKNSIEKRVLRAAITKAFPASLVDEMKKTSEFTLPGVSRVRAYQDAASILDGKGVVVSHHSREKFDVDVLETALKFMLGTENEVPCLGVRKCTI